MGNCQSNCNTNWPFVGRDEDILETKRTLKEKQSVLLFGMKKIGKSRFMEELFKQMEGGEDFKQYTLLYKDFELDDIESSFQHFEWFSDLFESLGAKSERERFEKQYTDERLACRSCEGCKDVQDKCKKQKDLLEKTINTTIRHLKRHKGKLILFLDNLDKLLDSSLKDSFLTFHRESLKCTSLKTVIASGNRPKQTIKDYEMIELKPLKVDAIMQLLYVTTEKRDGFEELDNGIVVTFGPKCLVFKEENRPYVGVIARLCEGHPLAAEMSGLLLTEDNCLYSPADLVEILICIRLKCLSPDNCPPDDRLDILKQNLEQMEDLQNFFRSINETMTGCTFTIEEAVAAADDHIKTHAGVKAHVLKKALDRSVLSMDKISDKQCMRLHGIFRECQADLKELDVIPDGDDAKNMVLKFMKENVMKAELDFDDEILNDPKKLEQAIKSLSFREKSSSPVQNTEDPDYDDLRMDFLKDDHLANEKRLSELKDVDISNNGGEVKQSPVLTAYVEVEPDTKEQNSQSGYDKDESQNKVEARYSPVEGSENDGSGRLSFELNNGGNKKSNFENPSSYTSQGAFYRNDKLAARTRNTFQSIDSRNNLPHVLDYSSKEQFPQALRYSSRSTQEVYFPPNDSENSLSTSIYPGNPHMPNISESNLRRARSDPCYSANSHSRNSSVNLPRGETDQSLQSSVAGPPALPYIPPDMSATGMTASNGHLSNHNVRQGDISQIQSDRLEELKDDMSERFGEENAITNQLGKKAGIGGNQYNQTQFTNSNTITSPKRKDTNTARQYKAPTAVVAPLR